MTAFPRPPTTSGPSQARHAVDTDPGADATLDALELWVADAEGMASAATAFGFVVVPAPADAPPGSTWLRNGGVDVIIRFATSASDPVGHHVAVHGDTVADVALVHPDPAAVAQRAARHGIAVEQIDGVITLDMFGDGTVRHSLRNRRRAPGQPPTVGVPPMLTIDHVAYCLPKGAADRLSDLYEAVVGFERVDSDSFELVGDDLSGMRSIVLRSAAGLSIVLTEPVSEAGAGQTQRFVDAHAGPGVQHAAITYRDLPGAVATLRANGIGFLPVPGAYYDLARQRLPSAAIPWKVLRQLDILVDADEHGLLYQLFTQPLTSRGTFFFELIQRSGASGFGANNVRDLFAAVDAARNAGADSAPEEGKR